MRIKICGITLIEDALMVSELGVDAVGLVFYSNSPRSVTINTAKNIVEKLPPFVSTVGLFVDADEKYISKVLEKVPLDILQFHGNETKESCALYGKPYIKAIRMQDDVDIRFESEKYDSAKALLLDTYIKGIKGGTGISFNWGKIPISRENLKPIILAGGLNETNILDAIKIVEPYAIDVSGGVESEKGIKDKIKVFNLIEKIKKPYE